MGQGSSGQGEGFADVDGLRQPRVAAAFVGFPEQSVYPGCSLPPQSQGPAGRASASPLWASLGCRQLTLSL